MSSTGLATLVAGSRRRFGPRCQPQRRATDARLRRLDQLDLTLAQSPDSSDGQSDEGFWRRLLEYYVEVQLWADEPVARFLARLRFDLLLASSTAPRSQPVRGRCPRVRLRLRSLQEVLVGSPAAEVDVDAALIEALLRAQFPELVGEVRVVASGWDNVIARVGDELCVRMPRRALSAPLVQHEADWLPRLATLLPVDVPLPVAVGAPGLGYPWTWLVCPWFEGRPLADVPVDDRALVATQLGGFVTALHHQAPTEAPVSPWRGTPLADLERRVLERLGRIPPADAETLSAAWKRCVGAAPHRGPPVWVHGDLHPLNVVTHLGAAPALRAVIDWGDLCRGDPATDLAIAWLAFDRRGRAAFRAAASARHPLDDPVWDRALAWAISLGLLFLLDVEPGTTLHGIGTHLLAQLHQDDAEQ